MLTAASSTYGSGFYTGLPPTEQPTNNRLATLPNSQNNGMGADAIDHHRKHDSIPNTYSDGGATNMFLAGGL